MFMFQLPSNPVPPPKTLSALLGIAAGDFGAMLSDPLYYYDPGTWHTAAASEDGKICNACLAGCIMRGSLGYEPTDIATPADVGDSESEDSTAWENALMALDSVRQGEIWRACARFHVPSQDYDVGPAPDRTRGEGYAVWTARTYLWLRLAEASFAETEREAVSRALSDESDARDRFAETQTELDKTAGAAGIAEANLENARYDHNRAVETLTGATERIKTAYKLTAEVYAADAESDFETAERSAAERVETIALETQFIADQDADADSALADADADALSVSEV